MFTVIIDVDGYQLKPRRENGVGIQLIGVLPFQPTDDLVLFPETALATNSEVRIKLSEIEWRIGKKRTGYFFASGSFVVFQDKDATVEAVRTAFESVGWSVTDFNKA